MPAAFMFPGQGSQFVGMGREVYDNFSAAREVFEEVDDTLGRSLSSLIFEGPDEVLTSTNNAQLALMAVSMAVIRAVEYAIGLPLHKVARYVIGHSVGEYSALCAAGIIELSTAARILDVRSKAMARASELCRGGMSALIGGSMDDVEAIVQRAAEWGVCEIANDNCEGQVVVSGEGSALSALPELVKGTAVKRVINLRVSGPFHSSLMTPAYDELRDFINTQDFKPPVISVVYNVSAGEDGDCEVVKDLVARQVVSRVRWRESLEYLIKRGCTSFIEAGPGEVLTGLLRRVDGAVRGMNVCSVSSVSALEKFVETREFC